MSWSFVDECNRGEPAEVVDITQSMMTRAPDPKAAKLREIDDRIAKAIRAYSKAQLHLFALRAERDLIEEEHASCA